MRDGAISAVRAALLAGVVMVATLATAACTSDGGGTTPSDPVLAQGQTIYKSNCAACHGASGGGGVGPKLAGVVASRYTLDEHTAIIRDGKSGGMPAFGKKLSDDEITAVARYEREALGQ